MLKHPCAGGVRFASTLALALILAGCAAGRADPTNPSSGTLAPEAVRCSARSWMEREQGVAPSAIVTWGPVSRDDATGDFRVVAFVHGAATSGGPVRRFIMDIRPAAAGDATATGGMGWIEGGREHEWRVVRAWGPREVGSGCTCHNTGESRLK